MPDCPVEKRGRCCAAGANAAAAGNRKCRNANTAWICGKKQQPFKQEGIKVTTSGACARHTNYYTRL